MAINSINVAFPMVKGSNGAFKTNNTTIDAIKSDLRILLLSNFGERCIHYDFGANLRELLFEPDTATLEEKIRDRVKSAVGKWMSFVQITDVAVDVSSSVSEQSPNRVDIHITFSVGQITDQTLSVSVG